jgi:hypothetical protein
MDYKEDPNLELRWEQVTCKRSVQDTSNLNRNFANGVQDFEFGVSGKNAWIPAKSYFRVEMELVGLDGAGAPRNLRLRDGTTYADNAIGCMYNNAYVRCGGQDLSNITNYLPQCSTLKCRLNTSGSWLEYVGANAHLCEANVHNRINRMAVDGSAGENSATELLPRVNGEIVSTVAYDPGTGQLNWANGGGAAGNNFEAMGVKAGDVLHIFDTSLRVKRVVNNVQLIADIGTHDVIPATIDWYVTRDGMNKNQLNVNKNRIFALWQPPVGIFDMHHPIGGGHFNIQLNPDASYQTAAIESLTGLAPNVNNGYQLLVKNVYLYVALVKKDMSPSGSFDFSLVEMNILNKTLNNTAGNQFLDFTVPPSTYAVSVFVQSTQAGRTTLLPPSRFKSSADGIPDNKALDLGQIQVTYGSVTKPATLYDSGFVNQDDRLIQRWISSHMHLGDLHKKGAGVESYEDFLRRGHYTFVSFEKDKNDTSTQCKVSITYNQDFDDDIQLFLVAHYSRSISIEYNQGYITQVVSVNR